MGFSKAIPYRVLQVCKNWRVSTKYTNAKWMQGELMGQAHLLSPDINDCIYELK